MADDPSYESTFRRTALVLVGLLVVLVAGGVAFWFVISSVPGPDSETAILAVAGAALLAIAAVMLAGYRTHRWTIGADGIAILERPKVPLTGFSRRRHIPFNQIAFLQRVESGVEREIAIITGDGRRHVISAVMRPGPRGIGVPDVASLEAFAARLQAAIARAGVSAPALSEGLAFWNRPAGLALLGVLFVIASAIAAATVYGLWLGATVRANTAQAAAIFLLLPVGAGWLFLRSLRRRRQVLRASGAAAAQGRSPGR